MKRTEYDHRWLVCMSRVLWLSLVTLPSGERHSGRQIMMNGYKLNVIVEDGLDGESKHVKRYMFCVQTYK